MRTEQTLFVFLLLLLFFDCTKTILLWEELIVDTKNKAHVKIVETGINSLDNHLEHKKIYVYKLISFEYSGNFYRILFSIQLNETSNIDFYSIIIQTEIEHHITSYQTSLIIKMKCDKSVSIHDIGYLEMHQAFVNFTHTQLNQTMQGVSSVYQYLNNYVIHSQIDLYDQIYIMHKKFDGNATFIHIS